MKALVAAILLVLSSSAFAHEWYPPACCSDRDCRALTAADLDENVRPAANGQWFLPKWNVTVPHTGYSPDGQFHLCESSFRFYCLFIPLPSGS